MSSILKALKKLEEEKNAKQGQRVDITKDIFGMAQHPPALSRWPLIAGSIAGTITLGLVASLFLTRPGVKPVPVETGVTAAAPPPAPAVIPIRELPLPPQEMTPVVQRAAPFTPPQPATARIPLPVTAGPIKHSSPPKAAAYGLSPTISANHPVISSLPPFSPQAKPVGSMAATTSVATATPTISVSGIAYNKEPADRLAFINGAPAVEGKTVSGVTVEEIMPDKVRFSYGQKSFEVAVGRSNQ